VKNEIDNEMTWGIVYRIAEEKKESVMAYLDHREKAGYAHFKVNVTCPYSADYYKLPIQALVYMATAENPNYLGPASYDGMALQILSSKGESGLNVDYVLLLITALGNLEKECGVEEGTFLDSHLRFLEAAILNHREKAGICNSE